MSVTEGTDEDTVLLRIYHGLSVNATGVLESDYKEFSLICNALLEAKLAVRKRLDHLDVFVLTEEGRKRAAALLQAKLENGRDALRVFLALKPPKIVTFLIDVHFAQASDYIASAPFVFGTDWTEAFVKHPVTWGVRNDLFEVLDKLGLACTVHRYVLGRGTPEKDLRYGLTRESTLFLQALNPEIEMTGDERKLAQLYYLGLRAATLFGYSTPETRRYACSQFWSEFNALDLPQEWLERITELSSAEGLNTPYDTTTSDRPPFEIRDVVGYRKYFEENVAGPLMMALVGTLPSEKLVEVVLRVGEKARKKRRRVSWVHEIATDRVSAHP